MAPFRRVLATILRLISSTIIRIFGGQNIRGLAIFIVSAALLQVKVGKVAILGDICDLVFNHEKFAPQKLPTIQNSNVVPNVYS